MRFGETGREKVGVCVCVCVFRLSKVAACPAASTAAASSHPPASPCVSASAVLPRTPLARAQCLTVGVISLAVTAIRVSSFSTCPGLLRYVLQIRQVALGVQGGMEQGALLITSHRVYHRLEEVRDTHTHIHTLEFGHDNKLHDAWRTVSLQIRAEDAREPVDECECMCVCDTGVCPAGYGINVQQSSCALCGDGWAGPACSMCQSDNACKVG